MQQATDLIEAINTQYAKSYTVSYLLERGNAEIRRALDSAIAGRAQKEAFKAVMAKVKATGKSIDEIIADL